MRWLEIRRHAHTKKGETRGRGSHLSQEGVELARRIGDRIGPFDFVAVTRIPRTMETALAMGFAADEEWDMDRGALAASRNEIPRHEQWRWERPFERYAEYLRTSPAVAELAGLQVELWRQAVERVPDGGRSLVIGHGGELELGLVAAIPDADHGLWGGPFRHCEGALLSHDGQAFVDVEFRRT